VTGALLLDALAVAGTRPDLGALHRIESVDEEQGPVLSLEYIDLR
jgi:hypothetical protein